jgi:hypothetical protein
MIWAIYASILTLVFTGSLAAGAPVTKVRTESRVDWTSAGIGSVGDGSGTITLAGVSGTIKKVFLYWHGIDSIDSGGDGVYDNETVSINGNSVTGVSLGDATTNCWGNGSSRAFRADVTPFVNGNGSYIISGMSAKPGHNANGASLVVIFDDGNPTNNRDLVFFEGNDSNLVQGFPGEDDGWNATLAGIDYRGGQVNVQLHLADGQAFLDSTLTFTGANVTTILDAVGRYDGTSVPSAGTSRASNGNLWDIHTFDVSAAFGAPGLQSLVMSGLTEASGIQDCLGLVVLLMDLEPGSAPTEFVPLTDFRDVRRPTQINVGPDVCGTGQEAINFTGTVGAAGDTWISVYDPAPNPPPATFGSVSLAADVLIRRFDNPKGVGLLALYNEAAGKKGLGLIVLDAGNTDRLQLVAVDQAGRRTILASVPLGSGIQECVWYRVTMDVVVNGADVTVTGRVFQHASPTDPDSPIAAQVGSTLSFTGARPAGVDDIGEVGIVAAATLAVVDSSVTNFKRP